LEVAEFRVAPERAERMEMNPHCDAEVA
jgi:hypothetical protein